MRNLREEIDALRAQGYRQCDIQRLLRVSRSTVRTYWHNLTYADNRRGRTGAVKWRFHEIRTASPLLRELFRAAWEQGIHLHEIARTCGVHYKSVSHWRTGKSTPNIFILEELAKLLGYTVKLEKLS